MKKYIVILFIVSNLYAAENILIVTEHMAPFQYSNDEVVESGLAYDILMNILDRVEYRYTLKSYPWARTYKLALESENVLIFSITRTAVREPLFKWVGKIYVFEDYLWRLKGNTNVYASNIEDCYKYKISVAKNDNQNQFLVDAGFGKKNLQIVKDWDNAIKMLFLGRTDLIMGSELLLKYRIQDLNYDYRKVEKVIYLGQMGEGLYFAFSRKTSDKIVNDFIKAYEQVVDEGIYKKILDEWIK